MRKELVDKLKNSFPELYSNLDSFWCNDGWFILIENLSETIQHYSNNMPVDLRKQITVTQVKEKFGELRYYTNHSTPFIHGAVAMAENMSRSICEYCGCPGALRNVKGWYFAACEDHFEEEKKRRG